jgi:hypothetical protein
MVEQNNKYVMTFFFVGGEYYNIPIMWRNVANAQNET